MIPKSSLPVYWLWMYYSSLMHYPLEALVTNEVEGLSFYCPAGEAIPIPVAPGWIKEFCPVSYCYFIAQSVDIASAIDNFRRYTIESTGYESRGQIH